MRQYNLCQNETQFCLDAYNLIQDNGYKDVRYGKNTALTQTKFQKQQQKNIGQ